MKKTIIIICILICISILPIKTTSVENQDYICAIMTHLPPRELPMTASTNSGYSSPQDPPNDFSWTNYQEADWTTPAKYQGTCGSCWAFAAVSVIEAQINIKHNNPHLDIDLSEQYILSCLPAAGTCTGGWIDQAFKRIKETDNLGNYINGIIPESCFPYSSTDIIPCSTKCTNWQDNIWEIEDYNVVRYFTYDTASLKNLLIEKGPLAVYLYSDDTFSNWGRIHHSPNEYFSYDGIYYGINHAITLVGYHDDPTIANGGYWICKNSWGTNWGYNGFFNIEYTTRNIGKETCWASIPEPFTINFTYSPNILDKNTRISFTPQSQSEIKSYWWNFDDGYYSDLANPKHHFFENGQYSVTLTVKDIFGNTASKTNIFTIPSAPPSPDFTYHPLNPLTYEEIQFIDETEGNVAHYHWDFGDGITSTEQNPTHSYQDNGPYTVILTISGSIETYSYSKTIQITNRQPIADFTYQLQYDFTIFLTDISQDADGTITSWQWSCSNGEHSTEQNPVFTLGEGEYTIILTITDDDDATNTKIITLNTAQMEETIDQHQNFYSTSYRVYDKNIAAQSFIPTKHKLTKIELYLRMSNNFGGLHVKINEGNPSNTELTSLFIPHDLIPNTEAWITFDFEDIQVTPGQTYFIVVSSPRHNGYIGSYYLYLSYMNKYPYGFQYNSKDQGSQWNKQSIQDLCFKTYGY
ncbi:MAG: PKD domain-containing protein [Candidatus Thermoplasmatota archaeon]|nr:PKD domain-containing protein [Candidatus Thermoplasmatota archaeon]